MRDRFELVRMAVGTIAFAPVTAPDVLVEIPLDVSGHDEIEPAIPIEIDPARTRRPASSGDTCLFRYVCECPITVVVIQDVSPQIGDIDIRATIIVVVADGDSHAVESAQHSSLLRDIGECAVAVVPVEPIPELRVGLVRFATSRHRVLKLRAIHEVNVQPAVSVEIEERDSSNHRLNQVPLARWTAAGFVL